MPNIRFLARGKVGEIWLYDQVGEGFFGGISAQTFVKELNKLGKVDMVNVHINSPGGDVFDGIAIHNALKAHPARVEVDVDGIAASIASVIAMAGDQIRMADNAMMMIHEPFTNRTGGAADFRKTADLLEQVGGIIVDTYAKRTGKDAKDIADMMAAETWMVASDAVQNGFADAATPELRIAACAGFDFSNFRRTPDRFKAGAQQAGHSIATVRLAAMSKRIAE